MKAEGIVSLWVGIENSNERFKEYIKTPCNEDGDVVPSKFMKDFRIDSLDEDFREADILEARTRYLSELLSGCSYEDKVISGFISLYGEFLEEDANIMIMLYNFDYNGQIKEASDDVTKLKYFGTIKYE